MKIEVIYHAEPAIIRDPLNNPGGSYAPPSIGLKVTAFGSQYGTYRPLDQEHGFTEALIALEECSKDLRILGLEVFRLEEGVPPRTPRSISSTS